MAIRPYILSESNWRSIKDQEIDLIILPWGACEAHNFHLPYGTDIIEADAVATESARKAFENGSKVMVLPTIPFGVNTGQTDIRLDINLFPSTQMAILRDIIEVLNRQGLHKLLVLNSHGGNNFKTMLRELGVAFPKMLLTTCDWYKSVSKEGYFENEGDHADEMETSVILYIRPDLVDRLEDAGDGKEKKIKVQGIREGWAWAERRWSQVTESTGVGDPSLSSRDKGLRYFEAVTDQVSKLISDLCNLDQEEMYE